MITFDISPEIRPANFSTSAGMLLSPGRNAQSAWRLASFIIPHRSALIEHSSKPSHQNVKS
jgi:hypothetical protein